MALLGHILIAEEYVNQMAHQRFTLHKRILRDSYNPFDLSDFNFKKLYRLPKNVIFDIIENLRPVLTKTRKNSLSVEIQVSIYNILLFFKRKYILTKNNCIVIQPRGRVILLRRHRLNNIFE